MADKTIRLSKENGLACSAILLTEGDNNTYTVDFVLERYSGGVDLSALSWQVNVRAANGELGLFTITRTGRNAKEFTLTWTIGSGAVPMRGVSVYTVEGKTSGDDPPVWRSGAQSIVVSPSVDITEGLANINPTLLDQLIAQLEEDILYVGVDDHTLVFE